MSAPLGPSPVGGDQDRGSDIMAMLWTECVLAMIIVALRFYARIKMRNPGADDWMMLITVVSQVYLPETLPVNNYDSL